MADPDRELSHGERSHIYFSNAGGPAFIAALTWLMYFADVLLGFDVVRFMKGQKPPDRHNNDDILYLCTAILFTVGGSVVAIFYIRRAFKLAREGVEVIANVTSISRGSVYNMVRLDYEYSFNGQVVRKAISCPRDTAREYFDGVKPLAIICDPERPRTSMLKSDVIKESASGESD